MSRKTTTTLTVLAAIPLALALLTGCSTASGGAGANASDKPSSDRSTDFGDWQLAYAACMRDNGIDMPDPGADGSQTMSVEAGTAANMEKAMKACTAKLGEPPAAPGQEGKTPEQLKEEGLKVARCFRENGVAIKDPKEGEAIGLPQDTPKSVIEKCIGGSAGTSTPKGK